MDSSKSGFKMTTSLTFALNGNTSVITDNFFQQIELKRNYKCALIDFYTYNSIRNFDEGNNLFHIGNKIIEIPVGSCELDDITKFIRYKLKEYNLHDPPKI